MDDASERAEVIVVGGGHAGVEAALTAARMGCRTLLVTQSVDAIGRMSCNPAIGGIGKSHLVKEVDALGGAMARATDRAGIQFRVLNSRKGPAVRATRAQADRVLYKNAIRQLLESQPNLSIFQQPVDDLLLEHGRVAGAITQMGVTFRAPRVVLTTGTFLGGKIHIGLNGGLVPAVVDAPFERGLIQVQVACILEIDGSAQQVTAEKLFMERPIGVLLPGAQGGLRGGEGVRVDGGQWQVAIDEPDLAGVGFQ